MRIHELKTHRQYFGEIERGQKTWELRKDDRGGFEVGDRLHLREFDADTGTYTGGIGRCS